MISHYKRASYDDIPSKQSRAIGIIMTIVAHITIVLLLVLTGFKITYPLPEEKGIEIELFEDVPAGIPYNNQQRVVENPPIINDPGNSAPQSARIAQSNQSTKPSKQPNAKPSEMNNFGDIEKQVEKPREVNQQGLFRVTSEGTENAENQNNIRDHSTFPGVGNNDESTRTANTPIGPEHRQMVTASLSGRSVTGSLPHPAYNSQNQGKVVVAITVDQNGVVTKANARTQGSTVQDAALWKAAEDAARKARFNVKKDAPVYQTGTITYIFQLN